MRMNKIRVSVVTPVYKAEKTIVRMLDSLHNQSYPIDEIVLVLDGIQPVIKQLILDYDWKFEYKLIQLEQNQGVSKARNEGISNTRNDYIAFLDADDFWEENILESLVEKMNEFPELKLVSMALSMKEKQLFVGSKKLAFNNFPTTSFTMVNKSKIGLNILNFNEEMSHSEDFDLWLRICTSNKECLIIRNASDCLTYKTENCFNHEGLSGNLVEMEKGELKAINGARKRNELSLFVACSAYIYSILKFIRRYLLSLRR